MELGRRSPGSDTTRPAARPRRGHRSPPDDRATQFRPTSLEPRDDYWIVHRSEGLSSDAQRSYPLVPLATARLLENGVFCEACFPRSARTR